MEKKYWLLLNTKHDFTNFMHICNIYSQICVHLLQTCENYSKYVLVSFSLI
jgi:hypothetical protein